MHIRSEADLLHMEDREDEVKVEYTFSLGVPKDNDHRIPSKKHLANEPVFVNRKSFLLSFTSFGQLNKIMIVECM